MQRLNLIILALLTCLLSITWVNNAFAAQKRIALVIGNANYKTSPLKNPVNDARDMTAKLGEYGFTVEHLSNASAKQMKKDSTPKAVEDCHQLLLISRF